MENDEKNVETKSKTNEFETGFISFILVIVPK